jgi:hypothetical protein
MNAMTKIEAAPEAPFGAAPLAALSALAAASPVDGWEGRPDWRSAAVRVWKVRLVAAYFLLLLADSLRMTLLPPGGAGASGGGSAELWLGDVRLLAAGLAVVGGLTLMAWLTGRTTLYAIDDHKVVMRYGVALKATLEIPFAAIEHVGVRLHRDHTGDIALRLKPWQGLMYLKLWPHARPWRLFRAEPMLRCVPAAGVVGARLCRGIQAAAEIRAALAADTAAAAERHGRVAEAAE